MYIFFYLYMPATRVSYHFQVPRCRGAEKFLVLCFSAWRNSSHPIKHIIFHKAGEMKRYDECPQACS